MQDLPVTAEQIGEYLRSMPGLLDSFKKATPGENLKELISVITKYVREEKAGSKGNHFFLIEFEPGEVVMPQGTYSDYVGLLIGGGLDVYFRAGHRGPTQLKTRDCWRRVRPWRLRTDNWLANRENGRYLVLNWLARSARRCLRLPDDPTGERALARPQVLDAAVAGATRVARFTSDNDFADRFIGLTGAMWNVPRSATLVADAANGCRMLTIKRKFVDEVLRRYAAAFIQSKIQDYVRTTLPQSLMTNRIFKPHLHFRDVSAQGWESLLRSLNQANADGHGRLLRRLIDRQELAWIDQLQKELSESDQYRLVRAVSRAIRRREYGDRENWSGGRLPDLSTDPVGAQLAKDPSNLSDVERIMLHRRYFAAACPGVLTDAAGLPASTVAVQRFLEELVHTLAMSPEPILPVTRDWDPKEEKAGKHANVISRTGEPDDAIYFILQGRLRIVRDTPAGPMLINNLERGGYFGESAIKAPRTSGATVEALTRCVLVRIPGEVLRALTAPEGPHAWVRSKLVLEHERVRVRDADRQSMRRRPPAEPPQDIAQRLQRATNLLLIDMDLCTRCEQCVRACGESHGDRPRFHRANPDFRFGKWEVAAACVHCEDAPCQYVCPVGAITFLDTGAVQVHRNRCIGCTNCAEACPYQVIHMDPPTDVKDAPCVTKKYPNVATKCDLCLSPRDPPCVAACPYQAARRGRPDELFPQFSGWAEYAQLGQG